MARVECYCNGILGGLSWARWRYWRARELRWIRAVLCFTVRGKGLKIKHLPQWKVAGRCWHDARRKLLMARGWTLSDSSRVTLDVFRRNATLGEASTNCNWRRRSCCSSFRKPGHGLKLSTWCARVDRISSVCARASWRVRWKRCWEVRSKRRETLSCS